MTRTSDEMHVPAFVSVKRMMKQNRLTTVLLAAFLVALLYGSVLMSQADQTLQDKLSFLTQEYISNRGEQSIISTFLSSLSTNGLYLGAAFLLGFFALGQPFSMFIMLFRGFGLGLAMGNIYTHHQAEGVLYCMVFIVPAAVLFTFVLVAALKDSIQFSNLFLASIFPRLGTAASGETLKFYCAKYAFYLLLILLISAFDAAINFLFSSIIRL